MRWRELKAERAREAERIEKVRADADYLRHAFGELEKLDARAGEEEELASRRAAMMQAEKVVSDLRDVAEAVSGDHSPMSALTAALRRLQRRQTQAPALIEPAAQALDAAISRARCRRTGARRCPARGEFRSGRAGAGRGASVRLARRQPQIFRRRR